MADADLMVVGAIVVLGMALLFPYGDALLKLFLIAVATALILFGVVQAVRRRRSPVKAQAHPTGKRKN